MSNEEPFNYIEHKIRDAAKKNEIVFEEESWVKMEALLDKDKRRRPFLWLWILIPALLAGGYGIYFTSKKTSSFKNNIYAKTQSINTQKNDAEPLTKILPSVPATTAMMPTAIIKYQNVFSQHDSIQYRKNIYITQEKPLITKKGLALQGQKEGENNYSKRILSTSQEKYNITITAPSAEEEQENTLADKDIKQKKDSIKIKNNPTKLITVKNADTTVVSSNNNIFKKRNQYQKGFYLLPSVGADVGAVKAFAFKNTPVSIKYGIGIGYRINKKLSVQTGLYSSRKKYIAGPDDYHVKAGSYWSMVKVINVNANCLVYEIPLSIRYDILRRKKMTYYTAAGISSYIMKREDYTYFYTRYNMSYLKAATYTGNKKLFSVVTLSAGAEKKINNKIAFVVESSFSIPVSGAGDGEVKLFSTAIQLGIKYAPFKKK